MRHIIRSRGRRTSVTILCCSCHRVPKDLEKIATAHALCCINQTTVVRPKDSTRKDCYGTCVRKSNKATCGNTFTKPFLIFNAKGQIFMRVYIAKHRRLSGCRTLTSSWPQYPTASPLSRELSEFRFLFSS